MSALWLSTGVVEMVDLLGDEFVRCADRRDSGVCSKTLLVPAMATTIVGLYAQQVVRHRQEAHNQRIDGQPTAYNGQACCTQNCEAVDRNTEGVVPHSRPFGIKPA